METKINIAEILKDKPQGTKLYSLTYGDCSYQEYTGDFGIECHSQNGVQLNFDEYGKYCIDGECILFPSKSMRDWSKFVWKKGDILVSNDSTTKVIFNGWDDDTYTLFRGAFAVITHNDGKIEFGSDSLIFVTCNYKGIEVEDDAQFYINYIERKLGGKLNLETLEIEKAQPEFKDGDIVTQGTLEGDNAYIIKNCIDKIDNKYTYYARYNIQKKKINHDDWSHISPFAKFATDSEKQQLFSALAKEGKAWDSKKKMIVDLKLKHEFEPFDKIIVLERFASKEWVCDMFSHYSKDYVGKEIIIGLGGCTYYKALPFNEETAKLLGTTKDVEG